MNNGKDILITDLEFLLKREPETTLSQRRYLRRIVDTYSEFVKNETGRKEIVLVMEKFLSFTRGKDRHATKTAFNSITKYNKHGGSEREFTIRKSKSKQGECKVCKEVGGRKRVIDTCEGINKANKELRKAR